MITQHVYDVGFVNLEALPFLLADTTLTQVVSGDCYLQEVQAWALPDTGPSDATVGFTVFDNQGTPVHAMSKRMMSGEGEITKFGNRLMKGGISVQADVAGRVSVYIKFAQRS